MKTQLRGTILIVATLSGLFFSSCNEGDDTVGLASANIKMQAISNNSNLNTSGRVLSDITFTEVLVGVTEVELEKLDADDLEDELENELEDDELEIEFEGQFIIDLLQGLSNSNFGFTNVPPGVYEELEMEMEPIIEGGHTIYVAFDFVAKDATESLSVIYTYDKELSFELESDRGFNIEELGLNQLLVLFDLDKLLAGVDLSMAVANNDGIIEINGNNNAELAGKIEANLTKVLEAGEDDDDDGYFDYEDKDENNDED